MSRIKWNLDQLEEVRQQHDEAMVSTEQVIEKGKTDLASMTEEVWEGKDADIARNQLSDLLNKEMVKTWKELDACNMAIQKAQKTAFESKNLCNGFPQIFQSGSMPSDTDQGACSGELLCDSGNCEELKGFMEAAGSNALNVKSKVESAESILAELETDAAKFDYSSYTAPIKTQTQNVADRSGTYNGAVSKYVVKTTDMDNDLSKELIDATPTIVPVPFDPSCLLQTDSVHMNDGDVINFLEEYKKVQLSNNLSMAKDPSAINALFTKPYSKASNLSFTSSKNITFTNLKNVTGANTYASNSGNNSATDPYAEYKTGITEVDDRIDELFEEYGDDLNGLAEEGVIWEDCDDTTKKALAAIYQVSIDKVDKSFDNSECEKDRARAGNILHTTADFGGCDVPEVFNPERIADFESYLDTNGVGYEIVQTLKTAQKGGGNNVAAFSYLDISIVDAGISFGYRDPDNADDVEEQVFYTSEDRALRYIKKCEGENPGCFEHEYSLLDPEEGTDQEALAKQYAMAQSSDDMTFLDRLFKSDESYKDVFSGDPGELSANVKLILGNHANILAADANGPDYKEYFDFCNAVISDPVYAGKYIESVAVGSGLAADSIIEDIWANDYTGEAEKAVISELNRANNNELLWNSIYGIYNDKSKDGMVLNMKIDPNGGVDFKNGDSFTFSWAVFSTGMGADQGSEHKVVVNALNGTEGTDWICGAQLEKLERLKEEAAKDVAIDTACSLLGIYCKEAGKGLKLIVDFSKDQAGTVKDEALDAYGETGKTAKSQVTLFNALDGLYSKLSGYHLEKELFGEISDTALSDTVMGYQCDGKPYYYTKLNDYYRIKALKDWDKNGCSALYEKDGDKAEAYWGSLIENEDIVDNVRKNTTSFVFIHHYTDEEIKAALNAIVYGCNDPNHSSGDYKSVRDIPNELRIACVNQLNINNDTDYGSVEDEYNAHVRELQK